MEYEIKSIPNHQPAESGSDTESTIGTIGRGIARTAARVGETALGLPGDILSTAQYFHLAPQFPKGVSNPLPTSESIRENVTKPLTGGYLDPKTEAEGRWDEFVGDLTSLLIPGGGEAKFAKTALKAAGGVGASWLAKQAGGGAGTEAASKIGFHLLSGFAGGRSALVEKMKTSYRTAEELSRDAKVGAETLKDTTEKILKYSKKGLPLAEKEFLSEKLSAIPSVIEDNKISIPDAWQFKRDINALIGDPKTPKKALPGIKQVGKEINGMLTEYGKTNKEFLKNFREAEDIYKGLNQASTVNKFLQQHVNLKNMVEHPVLKGLLLGGVFYGGGIPGELATIGAAYGTREAVKMAELLKNSSQARTFYGNIVKSSMANNSALAIKNIAKLDKLTKDAYPEDLDNSEPEEFEITKM